MRLFCCAATCISILFAGLASPAWPIESGDPPAPSQLTDTQARAHIQDLITAWLEERGDGKGIADEEGMAEKLVALGARHASLLMALLRNERMLAPTGAIVLALGRMKCEQAKPLFLDIATKGKDPALRSRAIEALAELGDPKTIPMLMGLLSEEHATIVLAAKEALRAFAKDDAHRGALLQELLSAAFRAEEFLQLHLIDLLLATRSRRAEEVLSLYLSEPSVDVRAASIVALGQLDVGFDVAQKILEHFRSGELAEKREAAMALGRLKYVPALEPLTALLEHDDAGLRGNAYWALKQISGCAFPPQLARWEHWREKTKIENRARLDFLSRQLQSGDAKLKPLVIEEMSGLVFLRAEAAAAIAPLAHDSDFRVRAAAYRALGRISDRKLLPLLIEGLNDGHAVAATAAWQALREGSGQAFPKQFEVWEAWFRGRE